MHACMHVCMFACMHVCMYACMHACMHACMYGFYVCIYHIVGLSVKNIEKSKVPKIQVPAYPGSINDRHHPPIH